jgi:hypothetical protein
MAHMHADNLNESHIGIHTRVGNDYRNWALTAQALFAGSTILTRERERARENMRPGLSKAPIELRTAWVELMLAAFGIECLIKAIWIKKGHQLAHDGKYVPMTKNDHQLVKLCRVVGITLDPRETDALERIADIAGAIGRYPIPRRSSPTHFRGGRSWSSTEDHIIENLVARLKMELRNASLNA